MMTTVFVLVAAAAFLGIALWKREVALVVFCGALPAYLVRFSIPLARISLPSTLLEILFWILFFAWLFLDARKRPDAWRALENWAVPVTLLMVGATIGVLIAQDLRAALGVWRAYFLEPILFFPMFVDIVVRSKRGAWILGALAACVALLGITAVCQKITGFGIPNRIWAAPATRRITSVYGFPNAISLFSAPLVTLMIGWTLALARAKKIGQKMWAALPAIAALLGIASIVFAVSKGGMTGVAVGVIALGLFDKRLRPWALSAIIAACAVASLYPPATNYLVGIVGLDNASSSVRSVIWHETYGLLRDHPIFGAGLSGYPAGIAPYHAATWIEIFQYPHDVILNFWSETGLIGLFAFLWIVVRFFRVSYAAAKKSGWIAPACAAAMITLLVHGTVDVPYFKNDLAFLFWVIVGIVETVRVTAPASFVDKAREIIAGKPESPWSPEA
jgi:putative inorganic carbon (HCO3(-)) transporter